MKKILLSFALVSALLSSKAQAPLPYSANFNNQAALNEWSTNLTQTEIGFASYQDPLSSCAQNPGGVVINKQTAPIAFLSPNLAYIGPTSQITFRFKFFAYSSNSLNCNTTLSCNATVRIYVVNTSYVNTAVLPSPSEIYGQSASTVVATANGTTPTASVSATVPSTVAANTNFKVLLYVENLGACGNGNSTRYVIDDVNILDIGQTVTPVSFKAFNASRNKSNVGITWTTASEQNNNGFYVQRNDGEGWKNVAFIFSQAPSGNSASDLTYSFTDPNNIKGVSQYRILQVDIDGKSKFSDIRSVKGEGQLAKVIVYPNPSSTGDINVVFDGQATRDVNVSDFSGRLIKKYSNVVNNLEIKGLTTGVYSILVTEKLTGVKFVQKVVVK